MSGEPSNEGMRSLLGTLGFDEKTVNNTLSNTKLMEALRNALTEAGLSFDAERNTANLLYLLITRITAASARHRPLIARAIGEKRLKTIPQVEAALTLIKEKALSEINDKELNETCGVGIEVTLDEIKAAVASVLGEVKETLVRERYSAPLGQYLGKLRSGNMKWANGADLKTEFDNGVLALLGPKTEEDSKPKKKEAKPAPAAAAASSSAAATPAPAEEKKSILKDFDGRELANSRNTPEVLEATRKATGGKTITRFPPEPNGYLHLGHAKSCALNFGISVESGGDCILRYDDTNPDAEKLDYIRSIRETVEWLGHRPAQITYSSDNFEKLYNYAVQLVKKGLAYVDHSTAAEMREGREKMTDSPYRNRSIEENLRLFEDMRKGKVEEGVCTLRLKMDMKSPNPNMRDLVAYRVKYTEHPHCGDKWCIYPTYDYTHCICDSLENITYSLCTLEFEVRREPYFWILDSLGLYKPNVWEFSRLNITTNVLSKRKLNKLVTANYVHGWDDPRLLTVMGMRRRGYTPEAINEFCRLVGVSRNDNTIGFGVLELACRQDLDVRANRAFAVLKPLRVVLTNFPADKIEIFKAPNHPKMPERGQREMPLTRVVYIDRTDFRLDDSADYYGLAPNKEVALKYAYNITCTAVKKDEAGEVVELEASIDFSKKNKPKGNLHWVAEPTPGVEPASCEARLYDVLFNLENPAGEDNWLEHLNPESEIILSKAYVEPGVKNAKHYEKFQFERVGYFSIDPDSSESRLVINRTVELRDKFNAEGKASEAVKTASSKKKM